MEREKLKNIVDYTAEEQLIILKDICARIYIYRNISLNRECVIEELKAIDMLFRDDSENFN